MNLAALLIDAARKWPDAVAYELPGHGAITYSGLDGLSADIASALGAAGVEPGDRVGICLPKTIDAVAAIFGVLRRGAVYVPTGADTPASRTAFVFRDCEVAAAFVDAELEPAIRGELDEAGFATRLIPVVDAGDGSGIGAAIASSAHEHPGPSAEEPGRSGSAASAGSAADGGDAGAEPRSPRDIAYILYTSGSTGVPKGVTISHEAALSFIDWCSGVFEPGPSDRFSSHAPFHFDLSILDIYVPLKHGATCVLIGEGVGKDPKRLGELMEEARLTSWYSTPSVLGLLARFGGVENRDLSTLRTVVFAGEVMPVRHLRTWKALVPGALFYNLYGPTETNVCTYLRIPDEVPEERTEPYPIGRACEHYAIRVIDERGAEVAPGAQGELIASGPGVMTGYWNRPDLDEGVFIDDEDGVRWYRTGDIVAEDERGDLQFFGRRDRMVKRRGYRVELDEIEAALYQHPSVAEVAVVALEDEVDGVKVHAFLTTEDEEPLSVIALKSFCMEKLPAYMVPDRFGFRPSLPKTRTDKMDYVQLQQLAAGA